MIQNKIMNQNKIKLARIAWPPPPGPLLWTQRRADPQTRSEQDPSLTKAARELHENMRVVEEADDISMKMQLQLRKILFKKKRWSWEASSGSTARAAMKRSAPSKNC